MRPQFFILLFSAIFLISNSSKALLRFEDAVFPEIATNGRALAMGNAFICRSDDSGSFFYNPAGLGSVRLSHFHLTNLHLEINDNIVKRAGGGTPANVATEIPKTLSLEGMRRLLIQHPGKMLHERFNFMPNILFRYFGLGYVYSQQNRAYVADVPKALFQFATRTEYGPFVGLNISLFGGIIKFGASGVYLFRQEMIKDQNILTPVVLKSSLYTKGRAIIGTGGFRLVLPIAWLPTISVNKHNFLNANFSQGSAGAPTAILASMDGGISVTPQIGDWVRLHIEVNYKDFTRLYSGISAKNRITAGMELDFARKMFLRVGYGDGFGSGGIGIKSKRLEFDLTSYAVSAQSSTSQSVGDRRYAMTLSSGF